MQGSEWKNGGQKEHFLPLWKVLVVSVRSKFSLTNMIPLMCAILNPLFWHGLDLLADAGYSLLLINNNQ